MKLYFSQTKRDANIELAAKRLDGRAVWFIYGRQKQLALLTKIIVFELLVSNAGPPACVAELHNSVSNHSVPQSAKNFSKTPAKRN